jgi:hypothetical protein
MSRLTPAPYEIGRVSAQCAASGRPLVPGEPFVAALVAGEGETLERRDYSPEAWASGERPPRLFASWRGVVPDPAAKAPAIDADAMLGLFESLADADDARHLAFRHVLALILLRKRLLIPAGSRPATANAPAALLVRLRGTPPESAPIAVSDPAMDEATVLDITERLRALLGIEA